MRSLKAEQRACASMCGIDLGAWGIAGVAAVTRPRAGAMSRMLLRKEVIQPHLPIRLPCYDFTPITGPTLDGCPPYGLAHRFRVLPTLVV